MPEQPATRPSRSLPATPLDLETTFYQLGWSTMIGVFDSGSELGRIARARAALASQSRYTILRHLQELRLDTSLASMGMRTLLAAQIGDADIALMTEFPDAEATQDFDELGASWHYAGRCIALAQQARWGEALESLGVAKLYARRLGLVTRVQALHFESLRIATLAGFPDPEAVQLAMKTPEISDPTRNWLGSIYVCSRLGLGNYSVALESSACGSDLAYLCGALMGPGHATRPEDPNTSLYIDAADSWMQLWRRERVSLRLIGSTSTCGLYARLASGFYLSQSPAGAQQALDIIGTDVPDRPDQRVLWAAVALASYCRGGDPMTDPLELTGILASGLERLRGAGEVLNIVQEFAPEVIKLAAMGPRAHLELRYSATLLPTLAGTYITIDDRRLDVGPRGLSMVTAGARCEVIVKPPTRTANLGIVSYAIDRLRLEAGDQERHILAHHWTEAQVNLADDLDPKLDTIMDRSVLRCFSPLINRRLEA